MSIFAPSRAALAFTESEITALLKRRFSCSLAVPLNVQSVRVRNMSGSAQVFRFLTEYCPRIGMPGTSFAVVAPGPGGIALLLPRPMPFLVESVTVNSDGFLTTTNFDYAPDDPRCCPSRRTRQMWMISGNGFVPTN